MSPEHQGLWQRLEAHVFDDPGAGFPFSLRLAKENGWSLGCTRRAVAEYRRFAFLAVAAGHPVSPPDAVDQVWHLHLLYTRDYWGEFCPEVLRAPLHHGPTRGGADERDKFADWYGRTLASYRRFFGEPPADLWPATPAHPRTVRVDLGANWVVKKPRWPGRLRAAWRAWLRPATAGEKLLAGPERAGRRATAGALAALAFLGPSRAEAAAANGWPLDLPGPEFLAFYGWFAAGVFALAAAARWWLRGPGDGAERAPVLDAYETAQLAGGQERVLEAVAVNLRNGGLIEIAQGEVRRTEVPAPARMPLLENVVLAAVSTRGTEIRAVRAAIDGALTANAATLVAGGLVVAEGSWPAARLGPLLVALTVPLLGVVKIGIGLSLFKPVGFLVVLTLLALVVALVAFARRVGRTRRGDAVLERLRAEHARLSALGNGALDTPTGAGQLPLAVGLFGLGVLSGTALAGVSDQFKPIRQAGSGSETSDYGTTSGDSSGGGDSGGGDGGSSGCGGCGGGGGGGD